MRRMILPVVLALGVSAQTLPEIPVAPPMKSTAAQKWKIRYFYDEDKTELSLTDMSFAGAKYGVAVGAILERKGRPRGTALITRDGGAKWTLAPLKEPPISVFPLGEGRFYVVASKELYYSDEAGLKFERRKAPEGLLHVYFLDDRHGFGAGAGKTVWKTEDGAHTWTMVPESESLKVTDEWTTITCVEFLNSKHGAIAGFSKPPRYAREPDWVDPERALRRRQLPSTTILMETGDGGATWATHLTSVFGVVTRLQLHGLFGVSLFSFDDDFAWSSEVDEIDLHTGKSHPIFRRKDVTITDVLLLPSGSLVLAGIQPAGKLRTSPVPGKLRVFTSEDQQTWSEDEVDYRAAGHVAMLAAAGDRPYVALDSGMILTPESK